MGLIDTISLFGTAVLAAPIALLGVEFLIEGRTLAGIGFVGVAAALVVGQHYVPGVKDRVFGPLVDLVVADPDERDSTNTDDDDLPDSYR